MMSPGVVEVQAHRHSRPGDGVATSTVLYQEYEWEYGVVSALRS